MPGASELTIEAINRRERAADWHGYKVTELERSFALVSTEFSRNTLEFERKCKKLSGQQQLDVSTFNKLLGERSRLLSSIKHKLNRASDEKRIMQAYEFEQYLNFLIKALAAKVPDCSWVDYKSIFLSLFINPRSRSGSRCTRDSGFSDGSSLSTATSSIASDIGLDSVSPEPPAAAQPTSALRRARPSAAVITALTAAAPASETVPAPAAQQAASPSGPSPQVSALLTKLSQPLQSYRTKRESNRREYFLFGHRATSFSRTVKLAAAEKLINALQNAKYSGSFGDEGGFSEDELRALDQGNLGKEVARLRTAIQVSFGGTSSFMERLELDVYIAKKLHELGDEKAINLAKTLTAHQEVKLNDLDDDSVVKQSAVTSAGLFADGLDRKNVVRRCLVAAIKLRNFVNTQASSGEKKLRLDAIKRILEDTKLAGPDQEELSVLYTKISAKFLPKPTSRPSASPSA